MTDRAATDEPDEDERGADESSASEQPVPAEPGPELREEAQGMALEEPAPEPEVATEAAAPDLRGTSEVPEDVPELGEAPEPDELDDDTDDAPVEPGAEAFTPDPAADGPSEAEGLPFAPADHPAGEDSGPSVEILVGAAFAGGLALAILLRRLRS